MNNSAPVRKLIVSQIDAITINFLRDFWLATTSTEERIESRDSVFQTLTEIVSRSEVIGTSCANTAILNRKVEIIVKENV